MNSILYDNRQDKIPLSSTLTGLLSRCIDEALLYEAFPYPAEISLTLVDDEAIRELNRIHRGIDRPTDVLSFPLLEQGEDGVIVYDEDISSGSVQLGDIVISAERAAEQAESFGHSLERELGFLTVHSVLHLLGYDHELGDKEEQDMFKRQEEILVKTGLLRL